MNDTTLPKRLVGFNYPPGVGGWGGDVLGILLGEFDEGWMSVASHVSSHTAWAERDIAYHASKDFDGIAYEWVGQLKGSEAKAKYPPAPEVETISMSGAISENSGRPLRRHPVRPRAQGQDHRDPPPNR